MFRASTIRFVLCVGLCWSVWQPKHGFSEENIWLRHFNEGSQLRKEGRYAEAEKVHLLAIAEAERFGPQDRRLALGLNELAVLYHTTGRRLSEAEALYRRALAILEKLPERVEIVTLLNNLARLCLDLGKYDEVELLSKRALEVSQAFAPKHLEVANGLNNWADVHAIQGRYAQAEHLYRQALTILEDAFAPEHREVAYTLSHLAKLYSRQARYAEAESLHRRAIAILQKNPWIIADGKSEHAWTDKMSGRLESLSYAKVSRTRVFKATIALV
jgi:tetratricopeptide (TPR) repeat protein